MAESNKPLSERLKSGGEALNVLSAQAAQLEADLTASEEGHMEAACARDHAEQMLAECRDAEEVYEDLDDMRRGLLSPEEMYGKYLRDSAVFA